MEFKSVTNTRSRTYSRYIYCTWKWGNVELNYICLQYLCIPAYQNNCSHLDLPRETRLNFLWSSAQELMEIRVCPFFNVIIIIMKKTLFLWIYWYFIPKKLYEFSVIFYLLSDQDNFVWFNSYDNRNMIVFYVCHRLVNPRLRLEFAKVGQSVFSR